MAVSPSSLSDRTLAVVSAFYDAALDETRWPQALEQLGQLTASQASTFWVLDGSDESRLPTFIGINFDPQCIEEYLAGMARLDPVVRYLLANPHRSIVHDGMLGAGRDEDSRNYYDWQERTAHTRFRLVALHRTRQRGPYELQDVEQFEILYDHLRRALTIGIRLGTLGTLQRLSTEVLDRSKAAILLLDRRGRIVFMNRAAEEIQSQGDGIRISQEGVRFSRKEDHENLQLLIREALGLQRKGGGGAGNVMKVARPSGRSYGVWVTPMSHPPSALTLFRAAVCVVISDPDRRTGPPAQHLRTLFKLTDAEARLAVLLASGEPLQRASERLGITYGSARSRLTQLFQKTSTRSQSELIRLLLTMLAWD